jgi:site-specific DNA-methyltransferase (adenine-specific)
MDIFDLCDCLDDNSVDMILSDLPYGITACEWDNVIPFEPMWECFKRIIKPRGAIVLTASGKFTYKLVASNMDMFKYEWVWVKNVPTGFLDARKQPLKCNEYILIFGDKRPKYYPQTQKGRGYKVKSKNSQSNNYGYFHDLTKLNNGEHYFPRNILYFNNENYNGKYHPTQKPVALFEYLIRTYTQPGEVVFDPCVGSGTTALAARNTGRNYIVGDNSAEYVEIACKRLAAPYTLSMFDEQPKQDDSKAEQLTLFGDK